MAALDLALIAARVADHAEHCTLFCEKSCGDGKKNKKCASHSLISKVTATANPGPKCNINAWMRKGNVEDVWNIACDQIE